MIVGIDDTDSRSRGMCTTYLATVVAESVSGFARVEDRLLVRLNPNVPYKTRGNACLSLHIETDEAERVRSTVVELVEENAVFDDANTNPGVAFFDGDADDVPDSLARYTDETVRGIKTVEDASAVARDSGVETRGWKNSRGIIGAVAAVGASGALDDYTYELIAYRGRDDWGEPRDLDYGSFFDADDATYPETWDTVDRSLDSVVAVPNTSGPVVYGLRGTFGGVWEANSYVDAEAEHVSVFRTNQGTDAHLIDAGIDEVRDSRSYRVRGEVVSPPETVEGGHVFFGVDGLECAAFEPTKGFRELVRDLRVGDDITVCGSVNDGTLNVEKFGVHSLDTTERVNPVCDACGTSMESAGRDQGYRCRDCGTTAESKVERDVERELEEGWYEVPPSARRHIAKPLVRGGFENPHTWR